ncbi:MAG: hypothetical protein FWD71_00940 [Oscillospiraceae bacterium]|nr:hypothetical protein [Oscillospiraceae bacterium]
MRKIIALILIVTMIFICVSFTSCGNSKNNGGTDNNNTTATIATDNSGNAATAETTTEKMLPDVPDADYGGYEFKILLSVNSLLPTMWDDFTAEQETGDTLNDAVYARNSYIEDKYNIKITTVPTAVSDNMDRPTAQKMLKNSISAGDHSYDAALLAGYATCNLASGGFLMDMNAMPPLDLTKPWWDQAANRDLMIKNKMFYTTGDISNVVNEATYAILFNKKLIQDYGLDDPYALVKNGQWTYSKLVEMGEAVGADLNGDGKMDANDLFGALVWDDSMMGVVNSIGEKCAKVNDSGEIELTLNNQRVVDAFDTYINFALDKNHALSYQRNDWDGTNANIMFNNNQALFYIQIMELVVRLRAMDVDFGVIPYPKLDTTQTDYYSTVSSWHSGFVCVPTSQEDATRTAAILEAMAAESMYTLKPAYYDIALKGKYVRDTESEEMLDLIFSTKIYDLGWMYQIGGYNEQIMNLFRNNKTDFASMYDKYNSKALSDIDKINTAFSQILN